MGKITKIKLKDFKSFRNTIIPFVGGFTAIVGPNGSGKSNVLDAINFALGSPSMKTLRAGRLTDLVHHKSNSGSGEVVIELKNEDQKYEISRTIDQEGTSVFRLDKKRTTRSEITEFLASMNINPQSRNIIMQGEVSEIIHMSPTQRREVIDEISGISEYNDKKGKALKELEKVEEKMKEANIILYERAGYLNELKKERDQALRYRKHEERKDFLAKAVVIKELDEVQSKLDESLKNKLLLEKALEGIIERYKELHAQIKNWENKIEALNKEIQEKGGTEQIEINKRIERTKNEIALTQEKKKLKQEELEKLEKEISTNRESLESIEKENSELANSAKKLERDKKAYEKRLTEEQTIFDGFMKGMKTESIGETTSQLEDFTTTLENERKKFYELKAAVDQTRERISQKKLSISEESKETKKSIDKNKQEKKRLTSLLDGIKSNKTKKQKLEERVIKLENVVHGIKDKKQNIDSKLEQTRKEYHSLEARLTTLKQMTGNKASNAVVSAGKKGELKGIVGSIGELCEFESKYAGAVQSAGGPMLNFVITENLETATNAIKWLKNKKLGRTTFIPLDSIRGQEVEKDVLEHPKTIDSLLNLVKYDSELKPAFAYVFGDTVIIRNLDSIKDIVHKARLVTLEGELVEQSGLLTGGFEHGVDIAKEMQRMEDLGKSMQMLENQRNQLEHMHAQEELDRFLKDKATIELELRETEAIAKNIEERLTETKEHQEKKASKLTEVEKEINELKNVLIEKEKQLKEKNAEINALEKKRELVKQKNESPEIQRLSERLEKQQRIINTLKDQLSEINLQLGHVNSQKEMLEKKAKELEELIKVDDKPLKETIKKMEETIENTQKELEKRVEEEKQVSIATKELIEKRENLETNIRKLAEQRGENRRKEENKKNELNQKEIEKARLETRYTSLKQELGSEPDEDLLKQIRDCQDDPLSMKREVEDLEARMQRLEPVNLKAIQAYDEFLGEVDQIKERVQLLGKEKEAVIDLMEEIEHKREETFLEAFENINKHYARVYKEFYPEAEKARAGIRLQNAERPFEGGLLIEAKPAGKETKTIDELSTGEKTLAAIAFLFALQEYKPSPFYVLDESDSALDKSNSERLAQIIQKKAKDTQFIAITHNNPLMHHSDQIVGVTMDKSKGSSVVEVDMKSMLK
ncbi:chromosome segregation protein SMC [archaeon]|nr:chromosome segregation protein SMC [archaeon]